MDLEFAYQLLTVMSGDHEAWVEVLDVNSEGHAALEKFLNGLEYFCLLYTSDLPTTERV